MPWIFWLDIGSLGLSAALGSTLVMVVSASGIKKPLNRCFALFAMFQTLWSVFSLLLRLSLWLQIGNSLLLAELATLSISLMAVFMVLFMSRFADLITEKVVIVSLVGIGAIAVFSAFLFTHRLIAQPSLNANGTTSFGIHPLGYALATLPGAYMILALILNITKYRENRESFPIVSVAIIFAGFVFGGVLELPLPILSITNTIGIGVIGYAVLVRQIFNPMLELAEDLRREIAERRKTESGLLESEEQFRNLAEESPNMIFIRSATRVVYANAKCSEVMGYSRGEFLAPEFDIMMLINPDDHAKIATNIERHFSGEYVPSYEYGLVTKDGYHLECIITSKLITFNREPAILGIITDITEQKKSERFFNTLNKSSVAMLSAKSPEQIFEAAGSTLAAMGVSCSIHVRNSEQNTLVSKYHNQPQSAIDEIEELIGVELEVPQISIGDAGPVHEVVEGGQSIIADSREALEMIIPDDLREKKSDIARLIKASTSIMAPLIRNNNIIGMLSVQSPTLTKADIPAFTAFANQLSAAWEKAAITNELQTSLKELTKTQSQLLQSQKMEAIGKLAGGVAHDFNNLLTAISGYTDLLIEDVPQAGTMRTDLGEIKKATKQATSLTRQLLAFSRKQVMQPAVLGLNDILSNLNKMLKRLLGENIELLFSLDPELLMVKADPGQVEQVIINLCVNAKDAMPDGGAISLDTANVNLTDDYALTHKSVVPGRYVMLAVSDTGSGMDDSTKERLFEPFFTTKERGEGTGLGLSTVYGIVRQSSGHIWVYSEIGRGSTFKVYFPSISAEVSETAHPEKRSIPLGGNEHLLLVEDETTVRELVVRVLSGYGYKVTSAKDAAEALELSKNIIDNLSLVITDVIMPGKMTGRDLADKLLSLKSDLSILYISGYTGNVIVHHGVLDKGVEFLQKPFAPTDLAIRVREILNSKTER